MAPDGTSVAAVGLLRRRRRRRRRARRVQRDDAGRRRRQRRLGLLATLLALGLRVEAVRVALTAAVVELVAPVGAGVVVPLAERAAARTDHARQRAHV